MENYPGNTNRAKDEGPTPYSKVTPKSSEDEKSEPKKVEKVIQGDAVRRKKPLHKKFTDVFINEDAQSVGDYILKDVILPATQNVILDAVTQGLERMLFGDSRGRIGASRSRSTYTSYNRYSAPQRSVMKPREDIYRDPRELSPRARANHDFDEIILETKAEAEEVLDGLYSLLSEYNLATVADLYELVGQHSDPVDRNWGWVDLRGSYISRVRGGYLLDLPRPRPVD